MRAGARDWLRAERIGVIFQQFNLLPNANVSDNILLPLKFTPERRKRAGTDDEARLCTALGLPGYIVQAKAGHLSVGQQQRVAVGQRLHRKAGRMILRLAFGSLVARAVTVSMTVLAITLSVALFLGIEKVRTGAKASFADTISGTDLIAGARSGSAFILVPYVVACVHVPPPPANPLVFVTTGMPFESSGMFGMASRSTQLAEIGYALSADDIQSFRR